MRQTGTAREHPSGTEALTRIELVVRREHLVAAHARVVRNGGAPGVDGMTVDDLMSYCREHWARIREPLLSGRYILLDAWDRELERRGHRFVRYADDCNVYVRSKAAGARVLTSLERFLAKRLRLRVNRDKRGGARPWTRKFLGYSVTWDRTARLRVSPTAVPRLKTKLRPVLSRGRGRRLARRRAGAQPRHARVGGLLSGRGGKGELRGRGPVASSQAALRAVATVETTTDPAPRTSSARPRRGSRPRVCLQRPGAVVERGGESHARGRAHRRVSAIRSPAPAG